MSGAEQDVLGRFQHHPNPAIDFCCEVDCLEGLAYEAGVGTISRQYVADRISRAMTFIVGGDEHAVAAKARLRELEQKVAAPLEVIAIDQGMQRSLARWAATNPKTVAEGSDAQIIFCIADAKRDIATLAARLAAALGGEPPSHPMEPGK